MTAEVVSVRFYIETTSGSQSEVNSTSGVMFSSGVSGESGGWSGHAQCAQIHLVSTAGKALRGRERGGENSYKKKRKDKMDTNVACR